VYIYGIRRHCAVKNESPAAPPRFQGVFKTNSCIGKIGMNPQRRFIVRMGAPVVFLLYVKFSARHLCAPWEIYPIFYGEVNFIIPYNIMDYEMFL
jgi:hypothetical protein